MKSKTEDMHPELLKRYKLFKAEMDKRGNKFALTAVLRTKEMQAAYYAQGRKPLAEVNRLRKEAGMSPISAGENTYCVTWTMKSRHLPDKNGKARAFDIVIIKDDGRTLTWDKKWDSAFDEDSIPEYVEAARISESVGLVAGASFGDYPHHELPAEVK